MKPADTGFSLMEVIVALAIVGLVATFTIPKVLQASSSGETIAKLKSTIATLEQGWQAMASSESGVLIGQSLYTNLNDAVSSVSSGNGAAPAGIIGGSPCAGPLAGIAMNGYLQLNNGTVITGLSNGAVMDDLPWDHASHTRARAYVICIDTNGGGNPNMWGQDAFVANFNQYGSWTAGVPLSDSEPPFRWGNAIGGTDANILNPTNGNVLGDTDTTCTNEIGCGAAGPNGPTAVAGWALTQ